MTLAQYIRDAPPPNFFELLEFEEIRNRILSDLASRLTEWTQETSDPLYIMLEAFSTYVEGLREYFNNRSLAQLLKWSSGTGLSHIGATNNVVRGLQEDEELYRTRIELTPLAETLVGSINGIISNGLLADPDVLDVNYIVQPDLSLVVYILSRSAEYGTPSAELMGIVREYLTAPERLGWAERLTVGAPLITNYDITIEVEYKSTELEGVIVQDRVEQSLLRFTAEALRLGRSVPLSDIYAAAKVSGSGRSVITAPAADLDVDANSKALALETLTVTVTDVA